MISRPPTIEIQRSMEKNYHAFTQSHLLISVTFSTPTPWLQQLSTVEKGPGGLRESLPGQNTRK
jgi:hypothetical protein